MTTTSDALAIRADGFDADAQDPTASPIRGGNRRFKDAAYFEFSDRVDVSGKGHAVVGKVSGWQKLERGCPPEFLMHKPGEPKPERPHVDKEKWPKNLNGVPEHPWRYTTYLHLVDVETGEISTFSTNTIGGNIAIGELSDQVSFMRQVQPGAIPVVALESRDMPTQYGGTKPRPFFRILGWRERGDAGTPARALPAPRSTVQLQRDNFESPLVESPPLAAEMNDEIPTFEDDAPSKRAPAKAAKNGKRNGD